MVRGAETIGSYARVFSLKETLSCAKLKEPAHDTTGQLGRVLCSLLPLWRHLHNPVMHPHLNPLPSRERIEVRVTGAERGDSRAEMQRSPLWEKVRMRGRLDFAQIPKDEKVRREQPRRQRLSPGACP